MQGFVPSSCNVTAGACNATFSQLIDHAKPHLGTFEQFYYWSDEYYGGPGSPVILFTPGEINATGYQDYLTTKRLTGLFAQELKAAVVVLEHRYWGTSTPFTELTTQNLTYLTLENSIADLTNFARTAHLPFDHHHGAANVPKAPWLLSGGSYSGALTGWTASTASGTFWAYTATSAVVEAVSDFWEYFEPVQEGMPKNCSKDVSLVIDHVDSVLTTGSAEEQYELKATFGLEKLEHAADFGAAIENGPWLWQGNQFYTNTGFFDWCDAVEGVNANSTEIPGAEGVGLTKALAGYANWFNTTLLPGYCASYGYWQDDLSIDCFNTHNASSPMYTDTSLSNTVDRQWNWYLCNQPFGYWQDGAPAGTPSIVSRLVNAEYWIRQCALYFPTENGYSYGIAEGATEAETNHYTGGWDIDNTTRLLWVNGQHDPWRDSTVSADQRPGGPLASSAHAPVFVIPLGIHCSDLITENGAVNAGVQHVIDQEMAQVKAWFEEWKPYHGW